MAERKPIIKTTLKVTKAAKATNLAFYDAMKSSLVASTGAFVPLAKAPDELLGELFQEVQRQRIYIDGKTFVDLVPRRRAKYILDEYQVRRRDPQFNLGEFVTRHFYQLSDQVETAAFVMDPSRSIDLHLELLWSHLKRRNRVARGSLFALPYPYIVPGGRFSEQFYWDSYFIMLGLAASGRSADYAMIENMMKNYAFMIRKFRFIPTANRTYFLSRSQPPFFAAMVKLLAAKKGKRILVEYLPYLLAEYRFWMDGRSKVHKAGAYRRLVELPGGVRLNRYFDDKSTPRPESLLEDTETADGIELSKAQQLFLDLRAAAESGWDFSSRWFEDTHDIRTIVTTDIAPVDLNCLLYELEQTIAEAYRASRQPIFAKRFDLLAKKRAAGINRYFWSEEDQFFMDYRISKQESSDVVSLAGVFPLYINVASAVQAKAVADRLEEDFLKPGGLVTTLNTTGQQWDAPNGWAPLQWIAIQGLRNYGYDDLANEISNRWLALNEKVYAEQHKMIEKYNVENDNGLGGGGEYPLQDGFGWSNGVYAALKKSSRS